MEKHKDNYIEIHNITQKLNDRTVLDQVNLKIAKGEILGLLGPSGAGKTTLIRILTGQQRQTEGTALLLGQDTRKLEQSTYSDIGMVLDNTGLYERMSCYDNLKLFTRIYDIPRTQIEEVLEKVGLADAKKITAMKLSKGMRQRLIMARAILNEPRVLFLDEPTSGLDPSTAAGIHDLILEFKEMGTTVFLTTHNMEEATKLCDNVALLHEGTIVEYGRPQEICRKYNDRNKIEILLHNGEVLLVENDATAVPILDEYLTRKMIAAIHSTEPDLEMVFRKLTGRSFE